MAIVIRDKRRTDILVKACTSKELGPGKYEPNNAQKYSISYAPFASSSERALSNHTMKTPGPGQYLHRGRSRSAGTTNSNFASRVPRFADKHLFQAAQSPGPGSYATKHFNGSWIKKSSLKPRKQKGPGAHTDRNGVAWVKVTMPPSIPAPSQSFGYKENVSGDLVLQKPPKRGFDGEKGDTVGVGEYQPYSSFAQESRLKMDFGASKVGRAPVASTSVRMAPGDYEITPTTNHGSPTAKHQNMVFKSKTDRKNGLKVKETPGPGTYTGSDPTVFKQREVPKEYQFFGAKSPKSSGTFNGQGRDNLGPGTYAPAVIDEKTADREHKGGFSTNDVRWKEKNKMLAVPGPGSYLSQANPSEEMAKSTFGRNTSFGKTAKRFVPTKETFKAVPGPGTYTEKKLVTPLQKNSVFKSDRPRFKPVQKDKTPNPGVGTYDVFPPSLKHEPWRKSSTFTSESRETKLKRSASKLLPATLGPGTYKDVEAKTKITRRVPNSSATLFKSQVPRTQQELQNKLNVPGPGSYHAPMSQLAKRSYNITIAHVSDKS